MYTCISFKFSWSEIRRDARTASMHTDLSGTEGRREMKKGEQEKNCFAHHFNQFAVFNVIKKRKC